MDSTSALYGAQSSLAADASGLNRLKYQASQATPETIKETAKQFEALFMREVMKSMREATMKSGMLDSAQEDMGTNLLDEQFAVQLSGRPGGLADVIAAQLMRQSGMNASGTGANATPGTGGALPGAGQSSSSGASMQPTAAITGFVQQHTAEAQAAQASSGVPASYMLGQAGHESGWGKREITNADGSSAHNLFGIKATADWKGKVAEVTTTEYVDGQANKTVARFRAYDSYADSFRDFSNMVGNSPRYAQARQQKGSVQGWTKGLQDAGYATDPDYAAKLSRAINTTLRVQRAQG